MPTSGGVAEPTRYLHNTRHEPRRGALAMLRNYAESYGMTYNARQGDQTGGNDGTLA